MAVKPTLFGIANCDTVKRARAWLAAQGIEPHFHDFKKAGLDAALLDAWLADVPWQQLLNRRGTTWRKLDANEQDSIVDAASAKALMLARSSVVKRPVVRWVDGVTVGFDAEDWQQRIS
ncbi:MAG: ArsC family reductase [Rubrivivax sp.]